MRTTLFAIAAVLALPTTVAAQDDGAVEEAASDEWTESSSQEEDEFDADMFGALLGGLFAAEPLSEDQEARLPQARAVAEAVFPDGTYALMMQETMGGMFDGLMSAFIPSRPQYVADLTGQSLETVEALPEADIDAVLAILDPGFDARVGILDGGFVDPLTEALSAIEPSFREGLAKAYAKRFTADEMAEMQVFFATETGAKFASQSMLIYSDPQVMAASMEAVPAMMTAMPELMGGIDDPTADIPDPRSMDELNDAEKTALANLLGVSVEQLIVDVPPPTITTLPAPEEDYDGVLEPVD